jgi:6-pyruvoyltetrahydropterin/6-carboxytetrahydropterin synthase
VSNDLDARSGRTRSSTRQQFYAVRKLFDDLPCTHRSWAHKGKCRFLHGYERSFEIEFVCSEREVATGFVIDFGGLKGVRELLEAQFDHTTIVARDDPDMALFEMFAAKGLVDLRVMDGSGMEAAAGWVMEHTDRLIREATGNRVWVSRVEARESRKNAVVLACRAIDTR